MSKFWQKKYISKYTGEEIDAAVAAGSQVPEITIEDAGTILGVDAEGKIVAKTDPVPEVDAEDNGKIMKVDGGKWSVGVDNQGLTTDDLINTGTILTGFKVGADSKYLPVSVGTGNVLIGVNNGSPQVYANTTLLSRSDWASSSTDSVMYQKTPLTYIMKAATATTLLSTGTASETINVGSQYHPTSLWDAIKVGVGDAYATCENTLPASSSSAIYNGVFIMENDPVLGTGLFDLTVAVSKNTTSFTFDFTLKAYSITPRT